MAMLAQLKADEEAGLVEPTEWTVVGPTSRGPMGAAGHAAGRAGQTRRPRGGPVRPHTLPRRRRRRPSNDPAATGVRRSRPREDAPEARGRPPRAFHTRHGPVRGEKLPSAPEGPGLEILAHTSLPAPSAAIVPQSATRRGCPCGASVSGRAPKPLCAWRHRCRRTPSTRPTAHSQ